MGTSTFRYPYLWTPLLLGTPNIRYPYHYAPLTLGTSNFVPKDRVPNGRVPKIGIPQDRTTLNLSPPPHTNNTDLGNVRTVVIAVLVSPTFGLGCLILYPCVSPPRLICILYETFVLVVELMCFPTSTGLSKCTIPKKLDIFLKKMANFLR